MYHNRVKRLPVNSCWYLITNRVVGGSFLFGAIEKEKFRALMFDGEQRYGYKVWDYVVLDNHYHALIQVPDVAEMSRDDVLARWYLANGGPEAGDPGDAVLSKFKLKIHDISLVTSNFQQRFTQWYNRRNERWGRLFGGRFDSVILDEDDSIARVMAYITLNPVRAGIVTDPAEYRWSGYGERMAKGRLRDDDRRLAPCLKHHLGLTDRAVEGDDADVMDRVWARFRKILLGRTVKKRHVDQTTLAKILERQNKPLELEWPQRLMLQTRFVTKGVAIGRESFVREMAEEFYTQLGDTRPREPIAARAWDGTYSLRRHKQWVAVPANQKQ